jgi:hypothetical protein
MNQVEQFLIPPKNSKTLTLPHRHRSNILASRYLRCLSYSSTNRRGIYGLRTGFGKSIHPLEEPLPLKANHAPNTNDDGTSQGTAYAAPLSCTGVNSLAYCPKRHRNERPRAKMTEGIPAQNRSVAEIISSVCSIFSYGGSYGNHATLNTTIHTLLPLLMSLVAWQVLLCAGDSPVYWAYYA